MKKVNLLILLLMLAVILAAQQPESFLPVTDTAALKAAIQRMSDETQTIQSDFTQEKHLTMLEEVLVSEGRFLFRKPNDVRWEYLSPIDYTIVIFKGKFTIRDGEKVKEFDIGSNAMFQQINKMIVTAIRGDFVDNPDFESAFFVNEKQYLVMLKSLNNQVAKMLSGIEIFFNMDSFAVERVRFVEPGEDYTNIVFKNRRVNADIPDNQFELNP